MTDESKSMHETTNPRDSRQEGGNSGGRQNNPNPAKPTHGDPDRRSIGDDNDRGRQETQSAGSRERSDDDRSKFGQQQGQQGQGQQGQQGQQGKQPQSGNEIRQGGAGAQQRRTDSQGDRQSK